jgi:hypothetical protein
MPVEVLYLLRKDEPGAGLRDLDDVVLLIDTPTDDGTMIRAGTEGTVVGVWQEGAAFEVEFAEPEGALVTVGPVAIKRIGRSAA